MTDSAKPNATNAVEVPGSGRAKPGDQAREGTPQTAENICPACGGAGMRDAVPCPACGGSGRVIENVGDA